jgi:hypothetical protein
MSDLLNIGIGLVWALALIASWSWVLWRRVAVFREVGDPRSRRAVMTGFASWLTAVLFALALLASVFVDVGSVGVSIRGLLFTMGLGAFTGAGVLSAIESGRR